MLFSSSVFPLECPPSYHCFSHPRMSSLYFCAAWYWVEVFHFKFHPFFPTKRWFITGFIMLFVGVCQNWTMKRWTKNAGKHSSRAEFHCWTWEIWKICFIKKYFIKTIPLPLQEVWCKWGFCLSNRFFSLNVNLNYLRISICFANKSTHIFSSPICQCWQFAVN